MSSSQRQDPRASRLSAEVSRRKREKEALALRTQQREELQVTKRRVTDAPAAFTPVVDVEAAILQYYQQIMADDLVNQTAGAIGIQHLLLETKPPIDEIVAAGVVPRLLQFLSHHNPDIQYMSLWALTNIAAGKHEHTQHLAEHDAPVEFVRIMQSGHARLKEQACWALGNMAGDSPELRDEVLAAGGMQVVLEVLRPEQAKLTAVKTATWAMSNLCRGKPSPEPKLVRDAIPVASRLIFSTDKAIEVDALWTLVFLSDGAVEQIQADVAQEAVCQRLVYLLRTNDLSYLVPAIRILGNLMSGNDRTTQKVIDHGALQALLPLLSHSRSGVRKEACWSASNVMAGNPSQIQASIDAGLIPLIIHRLLEDRADIKHEASWCLANAVSGANTAQLLRFVEEFDVIGPLCTLLVDDDDRLVDMTLDAIERILHLGSKLAPSTVDGTNPFVSYVENADGVSRMDELQEHQSDKIFHKSRKILAVYFSAIDANTGPDLNANQQYAWATEPQLPVLPQGGYAFPD